MQTLNIYIPFLKIKRAFQITAILTKYAFIELGDHSFLFRIGRKRRKNTGKTVYSTPERIRQTIEALGPTYVKFGQILADRSDVVSDRLRKELKKLQSKVAPFDNNAAILIIEKALGKNINDIFSCFSQTPLAAASIGQVYRGRLKSGEEVVIKVQRPFIANKIRLDIYLMKYLARKLAKKYPELTAINIVGLVDEFSVSILKELDYNNEANNNKIFRQMFADSPTIKIPNVYEEYTTKNVIVSEYIAGITPDNPQVLKDHGLDPEQTATNGANAIFTMIMKHGFFHADPHPGNLFVLPGNTVAFIDFGMVGMLRSKDINFLADFTIGFEKKQSTMITKSLLTLCGKQFFEYEDELNFAIHQMLMQNYNVKVVELKNFSKVLESSIQILVQYKLHIPSGIFMLIKAMATLEKFAENLAPNLSLAPIVLPYSQYILKERYSARKIAYEIYDTAQNYINLIRNLPDNIGEILYKIKEGKIKHDIKLNDDMLFVRTLKQVSLRLAYTIILIGLFIGATLLISWEHKNKFGYFILYTSFVLILLLLIRWIFKKRL